MCVCFSRPLAAGGPGNGGDDLTTETESVMSAALPNRRPGQQNTSSCKN